MARNALVYHTRQHWLMDTLSLSQFNNNYIINCQYCGIKIAKYTTGIGNGNKTVDYAAIAADLLSGDRLERLENEALEECKRRMRTRQANLLKPRLIYEGPVNINYWMRKKRSGARK